MHNKFTQDQQWQSWVWVSFSCWTYNTPSHKVCIGGLFHWKLSKSYDLERQRKLSPTESRAMNLLGSITLIKHCVEPPKDWGQVNFDVWRRGKMFFPRDSPEQWYPSLCIQYSGVSTWRGHLQSSTWITKFWPHSHHPFPVLVLPSWVLRTWGEENIHRTVQAYLEVIWRG